MKYIKRHAEATVNTLSEMFGAILVAGPRQVGKTTMLQRITEGMNYATLDDLIVRAAAQEQSGTFFKDNPPPVFVDEIQKAPELFSQIKMLIDREHKKGQFFMCGSQQFQMMKGVSESLSGRIGLVTLLGFSLRERYGVSNDTPFLPTDAYFDERKKQLANIPYEEVWKMIHRGSMPELCENPDFDWQMFYGAYVRTYIERDVRDLSEIGDTVKFTRFMTAAAASTGQLVNLASMARDVGISQPTAERWLSILVASNIVYLLKPYATNITKRAVKTPKLYFYRDKDMNEIDLVIEENGTLYPLEMKKHADPQKKDMDAFDLLDKIPGTKRGPGGVICLYDRLITLKGNDRVIPINYL